MEVIQVKNLSKNYGALQAVDRVSFAVPEGSVFGMLGPNGAGKTTTIECIIGLQKRSGGEVTVLGLDPAISRKELYGSIGVQLQETVYQDKAKVFELCQLFSSMYPDPLDYKLLLERFGLEAKTRTYLRNLSGGERQKVAIVLALIANPRLVVLDELTTGLDPQSRREMWAYIKELQAEGRTIFMTTHYMEEAAHLCDQVCIIDEGRIVALDTVDGVIENAGMDTMISFETQDEIGMVLEKLPGVNRVEQEHEQVRLYSQKEVLTDLILLLREHAVEYRKINISRPGLEDAFLQLTGKEWKEKVS